MEKNIQPKHNNLTGKILIGPNCLLNLVYLLDDIAYTLIYTKLVSTKHLLMKKCLNKIEKFLICYKVQH